MAQFLADEPLSVGQIAERMGRPATAIHYHVRLLERAGLLRRAGVRRSGRRPEVVYLPAAELFELEQPAPGAMADASTALKSMSAAFRMAERDMAAALAESTTCSSGPHRSFLGMRLHCRLSRRELAELNRRLSGIEKLLSRLRDTRKSSPGDSFVSLTLALMPLRNRKART